MYEVYKSGNNYDKPLKEVLESILDNKMVDSGEPESIKETFDIKTDYNKKLCETVKTKGLSKSEIINQALELYFYSNWY